jgi:hypothetical protein
MNDAIFLPLRVDLSMKTPIEFGEFPLPRYRRVVTTKHHKTWMGLAHGPQNTSNQGSWSIQDVPKLDTQSSLLKFTKPY